MSFFKGRERGTKDEGTDSLLKKGRERNPAEQEPSQYPNNWNKDNEHYDDF